MNGFHSIYQKARPAGKVSSITARAFVGTQQLIDKISVTGFYIYTVESSFISQDRSLEKITSDFLQFVIGKNPNGFEFVIQMGIGRRRQGLRVDFRPAVAAGMGQLKDADYAMSEAGCFSGFFTRHLHQSFKIIDILFMQVELMRIGSPSGTDAGGLKPDNRAPSPGKPAITAAGQIAWRPVRFSVKAFHGMDNQTVRYVMRIQRERLKQERQIIFKRQSQMQIFSFAQKIFRREEIEGPMTAHGSIISKTGRIPKGSSFGKIRLSCYNQNMADIHTPLLAVPKFKTGRILERINRFVVLVEENEHERKAHINNTGRLEELLVRGREAYLIPAKAGGKTDFRLFAVKDKSLAALFDTQFQMQAFEKALARGLLPWITGCRMIRRNPKLGDSLMDFLLECRNGEVYLEIKSAVLRQDEYATYPDCPTLRGQRHIRELTKHARAGGRAAILFVGALPSVTGFKPFPSGDPEIPPLLWKARKGGVDIRAIGLHFNPKTGFVEMYNDNLPVRLND